MDKDKASWPDIVEYSGVSKKSISTIRRYIKANKIKYKMIKGKFYISPEEMDGGNWKKEDLLEKEILQVKLENEELRAKLNKAEEERRDLEMLVRIYENKPSSSTTTVMGE